MFMLFIYKTCSGRSALKIGLTAKSKQKPCPNKALAINILHFKWLGYPEGGANNIIESFFSIYCEINFTIRKVSPQRRGIFDSTTVVTAIPDRLSATRKSLFRMDQANERE
jgi:hypothetical protein